MKKLKCVLLLCLSMVLFAGCSLDHVTMDNLQDKLRSEANVSTKEIGINVDLLGVKDLEEAYILEDDDGDDLTVGKLVDGSNITSKNVDDTDVGE